MVLVGDDGGTEWVGGSVTAVRSAGFRIHFKVKPLRLPYGQVVGRERKKAGEESSEGFCLSS